MFDARLPSLVMLIFGLSLTCSVLGDEHEDHEEGSDCQWKEPSQESCLRYLDLRCSVGRAIYKLSQSIFTWSGHLTLLCGKGIVTPGYQNGLWSRTEQVCAVNHVWWHFILLLFWSWILIHWHLIIVLVLPQNNEANRKKFSHKISAHPKYEEKGYCSVLACHIRC